MTEAQPPHLTVLVLHHLDQNKPYLELTLKSLTTQLGQNFETIVLADSETVPKVPDSLNALIVHDLELTNATKKINRGVKLSHPKSQAFLFLSDDVVLGRNAIGSFMHGFKDNRIVGPLSNSDNYSRYESPLTLGYPGGIRMGIPLRPDMSIEDLQGLEDHLLAYQPVMHPVLIPQDWVCFYCVMIPRKVWEQVGGLDEHLEVRANDLDFCVQARKYGVMSGIQLSSFAFHFGSRTLRTTVSAKEYEEADRYLREKYSNHGQGD